MAGVRVDDLYLFYGKDAETAAKALGSKIVTREIPGLGAVSYTHLDVYKRQEVTMANRWFLYISELAQKAQQEVTRTPENWQKFLTTASISHPHRPWKPPIPCGSLRREFPLESC